MKKRLLTLLLVAILIIPIGVSAGSKKVLGQDYSTKNFLETLQDEELAQEFSKYGEGNDKINIYLFRGKGCSFCRAFLSFMNSITDEYGKYFNMVSFEVWYDENNWNLLNQVSYYKDGQISQGVPYIIIGDKVFGGYADTYNEEIKKAITDLYNTPKKERYDVFAHAEEDGLPTLEELQKLYPSEEGSGTGTEESNNYAATSKSSSSGSSSTVPIVLFNLLFVALGTIIVIVHINRKFAELTQDIKKVNKANNKKGK